MDSYRSLPLLCAILFSLSDLLAGLPITDTSSSETNTTKILMVYKLYTRKTINLGEEVAPTAESVDKTKFSSRSNITIVTHGYMAAGTHWYIHDLKNALLAQEDVNFIVADWSEGAIDEEYPNALKAAEAAGKELASFLVLFRDTYKVPMSSVHIIGHSMGGRVAASAGRKHIKPRIGRITGLDPEDGDYMRLADFVDIIHTTTSADKAVGAHADFWPNNLDIGGDIPWVSPHIYAVYMYTMSIARCDFVAYQCSTWADFQKGLCSKNAQSRMGHHAPKHPGRGKMYLRIQKEPPFC